MLKPTIVTGLVTQGEYHAIVSIPAICLVMDAMSLTREVRDQALEEIEEERQIGVEEGEPLDAEFIAGMQEEVSRLNAWLENPVGTTLILTDLPVRQGLNPLQVNDREDLINYTNQLMGRGEIAKITDFDAFLPDFYLKADGEAPVLYVDEANQSLKRALNHGGSFVMVLPRTRPEILEQITRQFFLEDITH